MALETYAQRNAENNNLFFEKGIKWRLRGIGVGGGISLLTGKEIYPVCDMSGFVESLEAGVLLVQLFKGRAYLDYRPTYPNRIQVKVCVEDEDKRFLEILEEAVAMLGGKLTPTMLEACHEKYEKELIESQPVQGRFLNARMLAWADNVKEVAKQQAYTFLDKVGQELCAKEDENWFAGKSYTIKIRSVECCAEKNTVQINWEVMLAIGWKAMSPLQVPCTEFFTTGEGFGILVKIAEA